MQKLNNYAEFCKSEKIRCVQNINPNTSRRDVTLFTWEVSSDWLVAMLIATSFSFPTPGPESIEAALLLVST